MDAIIRFQVDATRVNIVRQIHNWEWCLELRSRPLGDLQLWTAGNIICFCSNTESIKHKCFSRIMGTATKKWSTWSGRDSCCRAPSRVPRGSTPWWWSAGTKFLTGDPRSLKSTLDCARGAPCRPPLPPTVTCVGLIVGDKRLDLNPNCQALLNAPVEGTWQELF
jgi:hypothetical protein